MHSPASGGQTHAQARADIATAYDQGNGHGHCSSEKNPRVRPRRGE